MDIVSCNVVQKYSAFDVQEMKVRSPEGDKTFTYHVIDRPDSVQIVAVTEDNQLLLVEQERQGTRASSLEFVAGLIDEGESALAAAERELEEETGYCAREFHELGWYYTDPAILTNKVTVYFAEGCTKSGRENQDEGEDVRSRVFNLEEMPGLFADGKITHGLCVAAWHLYQMRVQRSRSRT